MPFLFFSFQKKSPKRFLKKKGFVISFFSALIFLLSPYQTEDVLWVAISLRWLLNSLALFAAFYVFILHLEKPSNKKLLLIHFLFLLGLFSNETALIFPILCIVLFLLYNKFLKTNYKGKLFLPKLIFPQLIFIVVYFFISKILSGQWIWHGPAGFVAQSSDFIQNILKYFAKFFLFYRYFVNDTTDEALRNFSQNGTAAMFLFLLVLAFVAFFLWRRSRSKKEEGYFLSAVFACFFISLLPSLPLDTSFLKWIYPDRYGYIPSFFFYLFVVSAICFLFKKVSFPFLAGYSILCWALLMKTILIWNAANEHCNMLIENYKPYLKYDRVYVLNVPAYYKGVAAFRSAFRAAIYFKQDKSPVEKIRVISGCYQESNYDSLVSVSLTAKNIEVSAVKKPSPYFSTDGGWAKSYETDEYKVDFDPTGCSYVLTFKKEIPLNSAFIYSVGDTWKKVD